MSQYSHLTADPSNENSAVTKIARLIGHDRTVLDVGCAHGYLAEMLRAQGCRVVGIEQDAGDAARARAHCEQVFERGVEQPGWADGLGECRFDAIVFADVLDHLRDPAAVVRRALPLLAPDGFIIASIPNVAHVSVRLELLLGSFRREKLGILDETHLQFFTRDSLEELLASCGVAVESWDITTNEVAESVVADYLRRGGVAYTAELRELFAQPEAAAFQFVVKGRPAAGRPVSVPAPLEKPLQVMETLVRELEQIRGVPDRQSRTTWQRTTMARTAANPARAGQKAPLYTGERPCWGQGLFGYDEARALAPYAYVAPLAAGKRVLDAGCGEGFGTRTLAGVARSVEGIDYSERAIAYCRRTWSGPGLSFRALDLTDPTAPPATYDLVLSFQVIEHIEDDGRFLETLRAWLAPGGTVAVVTPNRATSFSQNPHHVREYTAAELAARLRRVFASIEMLGVHGSERLLAFERRRRRTVEAILGLDVLGLRRRLPRSLRTFAFARLAVLVRVLLGGGRVASQFGVEDFPVRAEDVDAALDLLAVCRT